MTREYSGIDSSVTKSFLAAENLTEPNGVFVKLDGDGVSLPAAGGDVVGIAIISNQDSVKAGERVDVQIKDIGLVVAGGVFAQGALLATNASGKAVAASSTNYIVGRALGPATAAGDLVQVQLLNNGVKMA